MESIIWRPGIGDPTVIGWVTTIGYMLSSFLCARKARGLKIDTLKAEILKSEILTAGRLKSEMLKAQSLKDERLVWSGLAAVLFFLGLNKQLDFQTLLIEFGRSIFVTEGWYNERRQAQEFLFATIGWIAGLIFVWVVWKQKTLFCKNPFLLFGTVLLLLYVLIRTVAIERLAGAGITEIAERAWWLQSVEVAGIGCVIIDAKRSFQL